MMRFIITTVLFAALLSPASSFAADPDQTLTKLLLTHHETPTRATFERHVPGAKGRLLAIAQNPAIVSFVRERAIGALGSWSDPDVERTFQALLRSTTTPTFEKHRVLYSYARAFPDRAVPLLDRFVASDDVELRLTAITALGTVRTTSARRRLEALEQVETDPRVETAIRRGLERLGKKN